MASGGDVGGLTKGLEAVVVGMPSMRTTFKSEK
jgi:hypothetical protein